MEHVSGAKGYWRPGLDVNRERGGANRGLLIILALLALACVSLFWFQDSADPAAAPLQPEQPIIAGVPTRPVFTLAQDQAPDSASNSERSTAGPEAPPTPVVFDGKGTIRGRLHMAPGTDYPKSWTLIIEPSRTLNGKELAVRRVSEHAGDDIDFEVSGLPQAGYVVRATAAGMNSTEVNVLLAVGREQHFVTLKLKPAGFLDGGVTNSKGEPLEGVPVVLESTSTHVRLETETNAAGNYIFREVLDGEYLIYFGSPDNPLLPAQSVLFSAPSLRFPTRKLPHDGALTVTVVDDRGVALEGARIRGFGPPGGALDSLTDTAGVANFRFLPAGRFKLTATYNGRSTLGTVEVSEDSVAELTLRFKD